MALAGGRQPTQTGTMTDVLFAHEPMIRFGIFAGILLAMTLWEALAPARPQAQGRGFRWPNNLGLVLVDSLVVRFLFPAGAVGAAMAIEANGWGLFGWLAWPAPVEIVLAIVLLDLIIYFQHVLFHAVPILWRLHRVHHADTEFDVTTGIRFHPVEIVISMLIKLAAIAALGAPAVAVLAFEVLLNATAMFNHGNVRVPAPLEPVLRLVVVTPDMHRVHHSTIRRETDSNYGFNLPWWDRLFGTYRAQPAEGHDGMTIGLETLREPGEQRLDRLLTQPFRDPA
jgi:sterol desaturase/sphingolipid hydroxylase (fatty acid hydroxylase superfamily)